MLNCNLAIILATDESLLMKSKTTKYLHTIFEKTIIDHVCNTLNAAEITHVLIVAGKNTQELTDGVKYNNVEYCATEYDAIQKTKFYGGCDFFVLTGDIPLLTPNTVINIWKKHKSDGNDITSAKPFAHIHCFKTSAINPKSTTFEECYNISEGKKGEYTVNDQNELYRVSTRADIAFVNAIKRADINNRLMENGVTIIDPLSTFISESVVIGCDTIIHPNTIIEHNTVIGQSCEIGPNSYLRNMHIGNGVQFNSSSAYDSSIGDNTSVGPFAFIRLNSKIGANIKIGDFVEVKNSVIGDYSKASHLTYIGDSDAGKNINFGCGTITVNYDGLHKFRTIIKDNAFIGCNSNLISPVTIGKGAYIAAGSTITDDVPENTLAIARERQMNKPGWKDKRSNN